MNLYAFLAATIELLHGAFVLFLVTGLVLNPKRHPRTHRLCLVGWVCVLMAQVVCGFKCPVTLLVSYLRVLADPVKGHLESQPFVVMIARDVFGINVPVTLVIVIVVVVGLGSALCLWLPNPERHRQSA